MIQEINKLLSLSSLEWLGGGYIITSHERKK